jgi:hypothetical protein
VENIGNQKQAAPLKFPFADDKEAVRKDWNK